MENVSKGVFPSDVPGYNAQSGREFKRQEERVQHAIRKAEGKGSIIGLSKGDQTFKCSEAEE